MKIWPIIWAYGGWYAWALPGGCFIFHVILHSSKNHDLRDLQTWRPSKPRVTDGISAAKTILHWGKELTL
jgi:hypothetical protein